MLTTPTILRTARGLAVFLFLILTGSAAVSPSAGQSAVALEKFEIKGDRFETRNVDQPRTVDDITPYVVVDRELIDRSGAISMQDFITQLPQNTANAVSPSGIGNTNANVSVINSRGLGAADTLVLVNGRRLPSGSASSTASGQADLNTIPSRPSNASSFCPARRVRSTAPTPPAAS